MSVDCPLLEIINHPKHHWCADEYQTYQKTSCRCANACGPEAKFLAQLNCNEICRALFPGELFFAGHHFGTIHSHWQQRSMATIRAATGPQCRHNQRNYSLRKTIWGPFRAPILKAHLHSVQKTLDHFSSAGTEFRIKVKKNLLQVKHSELPFHLKEVKTPRTYTACNEGDIPSQRNKVTLI